VSRRGSGPIYVLIVKCSKSVKFKFASAKSEYNNKKIKASKENERTVFN